MDRAKLSTRRSLCLWCVLGAGFVGLAAAGILFWQSREEAEAAQAAREAAEPLPVSARFQMIEVDEPSGVAFHPKRGTLFIVSDEGAVAELDLQFNVIATHPLKGDLEGVTVHPETGTLFIASERVPAIIEYDIDEKRVLRTMRINVGSHSDFRAGLKLNRGVEGVTIVATGNGKFRLFGVIEQHPARLIELDADLSQEKTEQLRREGAAHRTTGAAEVINVVESYDLNLIRMSDVMFEPQSGKLLVTTAGANILTVVDMDGHAERSIQLPGIWAEGFAFLPNGDAVVVQDSGGMFVCDKLWSALKLVTRSAEP